jgi:hypothetical protein
MVKYIALTVLLLAPFSVFAQAATPQKAAMDDGSAGSRVLDGHLFLPSDVVEDPFTPTYLDESTGFGFASFRADDVDSSGNVIGKSQFNLGALGQGFKFQLGFLDSWAIRASAAGTVLSGIDANSALIAGATIGYTLSTGVTYSFMAGSMRMAGAFDLEYAPSYTFSPVVALVNTISTGKIDTGTLFTSSDNLTLRPAFLVAIGLSPSLGLRGVIDYEQQFVKSTTSSSDGTFNVGAAVDFDLHSVIPLPLGLLGGYKLTVPTSGDSLGHQFTLGLFYTAQRNLGLGIQAVLQLPTAPAGISNYSILLASLTLRYYWS